MKYNVRTVMSFCFLLMGIGVVITAIQWPLRTAFFPVVIGSLFIVCNLVELILTRFSPKWSREQRSGYDFKFDKGTDAAVAKKRVIEMSLWILVYYFCILFVGFSFAIPLFFLLFFRIKGKEAWKISLVLAAAAWASFYGLFILLLQSQYPEGWVQQLLSMVGILD